ncbi:MAG: diacylglycerol kinase family protein [Chloroflexota bacterium]
MTGHATLIVSPLASRIRDERARARVIELATGAARTRGMTGIRLVETAEPDVIRVAAAAAVADGHDLVILAGGDGTIRDASGALAGSGIAVGILPCGTGNLYATTVGLPHDLSAAAGVITHGTARARDAARVTMLSPDAPPDQPPPTPIPFVVACGTGFDARMIAATDRDLKRRYGVAAYFLAAASLLGHLEAVPTVLEVDGTRHELESVVVLVVNTAEVIPGLLRPRLPARPDDGLLHVFVLPKGGLIDPIRGSLEIMAAQSAGLYPSGVAGRLLGRHVRVEVTPPGPTQVDGDPYPPAWLEAAILPGALRVLTA